ncbi:MAG: alpha/beta hydrolase [Clostridia bacterium]|nr:alpha/beta hydrolase [Clostridia bacterium]
MKKAVPFPFETVSGNPFPNSEYYTYGDYKLHYRVDPAKTVTPMAKAFLIHGFACNTRFYDEMVERLTAAGISCLRVDLPDFGFSTREKKGIRYVPQTDMLRQMMKDFDEDGKGWILFGHSMGGSVAMQLALAEVGAAEKEIDALVLYAPLMMANIPGSVRDFMLKAPVGPLLDFILPFLTPYDFIWKAVGLLMTFDWKYTKQMEAGVYRDALQVKDMGRGMAYMTAVCSRPDISTLGGLTVPVQLILGGRDLFVMPNVAFKMWKQMPGNADKHLFLSGGHCFLQNQADRTWNVTKTFLSKNGLL